MGFTPQLNHGWLIMICLTATLAFVVPGQSQEQKNDRMIIATGTCEISGEDIASARETAIANGLKSAVETAALDVFSAASDFQSIDHLNEVISKDTEQFILGYQVLAEHRLEKLYRTVIEARVSLLALKKIVTSRTDASGAKKRPPRVLLCIIEKNMLEPKLQYWWRHEYVKDHNASEKILAFSMRARGFEVIFPKAKLPGIMLFAIKEKPVLSENELINLGNHFKADIVITGHAISEKAPQKTVTGFEAFSGSVRLKAIETKSRRVIASTHQKKTVVGTDPAKGALDALFKARQLAGLDLADQIFETWNRPPQPDGVLFLEVSGTDKLAVFVAFRRVISQMRNVKEVVIRELYEDRAILRIK